MLLNKSALKRCLRPAAALVILWQYGGTSLIGDQPTAYAREESGEHSIRMVQTTQAPIIDGKLDDEAWAEANTITNFKQIRPHEGSDPTEATEIRLLQDSNFVYVGIRAFDSEPDKIIANQMQRDGSLQAEDRIRFILDTFHNFRGGYYFAVNARGARQDGVISPGAEQGGIQIEWDGIWYGKSSIDSEGWTVEMAIPAKTLSFDPDSENWGFNIERDIKRKGERVRWSSAERGKRLSNMSGAGVITNIKKLTQGKGLDFVPYLNVNYSKNNSTGEDTFELEPGLDLFYKFTPAVTMSLTVNTDFAEAEVDDRIVNLTRFPIFFSEKRDFFLQDADIFTFGNVSESPLAFNSRRIGLTPNREPLEIIAGGKITGRLGKINFGLLNVQVDEYENLDSKNLTVGRASLNVFGESNTGMIVTYGDPLSNNDNLLLGYDFNYKNTDFNGSGKTIESSVYAMKSFTDELSGDDMAYGTSFAYSNDPLEMEFKIGQIEENFNPALGFVEEAGTREFEGEIVRDWYPNGLEFVRVEAGMKRRTTIDGELIDQKIEGPSLRIRSPLRDNFEIGPVFSKDQLFEPFEIVDGVAIPTGTYSYDRFGGNLSTSEARVVNASLSAEAGDFFTGKRTDYEAGIGWRPSSHFNISAIYETNIIELPEGDFTVDVAQLNFNLLVSPDLVWNVTNQWDSESEKYGVNSRVRWTIKPGNDLYFVINQEMDTALSRWKTLNSDVSTKLAWTFRY